jgi:putative nucleotidyltransferase with HDIG domain
MQIPTQEASLALLDKYTHATKQHLKQVGTIMEYFAKKTGNDPHYWWTVGILHDIDRDHIEKDGTKHLKQDFDTIGAEISLSEEIKADIRSHGHFLE